MFIRLCTGVALILLFAGLMLMLQQDVFASSYDDWHDYEYVICANKVWYPEGTDCKVALKKYYEEHRQINEEIKTKSTTATAEDNYIKEKCKDMNGNWNDGKCNFKNDDEGLDAEAEYEHALEDKGLYDRYEEKQAEANAERIEEVCDDVGGKMTKDGCETDHDGPKADKFHEKLIEREQEELEPVTNVIASPIVEVEDEEAAEEMVQELEEEENMDRSYEYEGEDESTETKEEESEEEESEEDSEETGE